MRCGPLVVFAATVLLGCTYLECTLEARPAFQVTVTDSITGVNLAPAATVRLREGTFSDTLWAFPDMVPTYSGLWERAGTYEVTVTHPAYITWMQSGVRVDQGQCHVTTVRLAVRMRPKA